MINQRVPGTNRTQGRFRDEGVSLVKNQPMASTRGKPMKMSDFLRRQAELCVAISRATFDLTTAGRLRAMATEFQVKAAELDDDVAQFAAHMLARDGSAKGQRDRG
jgi:hypothetical protein